jgi:hypothetical protein
MLSLLLFALCAACVSTLPWSVQHQVLWRGTQAMYDGALNLRFLWQFTLLSAVSVTVFCGTQWLYWRKGWRTLLGLNALLVATAVALVVPFVVFELNGRRANAAQVWILASAPVGLCVGAVFFAVERTRGGALVHVQAPDNVGVVVL